MKKLIIGLLALLLLLCIASLAEMEGKEKYRSGAYTYVILEDGTAEIMRYDSSAITLKIPSELDGRTVTSIGYIAFYDCHRLTTVIIPDSVTSIGDGAFSYCSSLTAVTIPDSVTSIGDRAFFWCGDLTDVTIPDSVTSIGDYAFSWCGDLTAVTIPDSVTSIGDHAFNYCYKLTTITIPDSVKSIGINPFSDCKKLTEIHVSPEHPYLMTINGVLFSKPDQRLVSYLCAFQDTEYAIPQGIQFIGNYAFCGCDSLTAVTIPGSVTSIGNWAFDGCSDDLTVTVDRDSYAEQYCKDNGLKYTYPDSLD